MNISTAEPLVEIKMQRNRAIIQLLEAQCIFLRNSILFQSKCIENNQKKIALIKKINDLETGQKTIYELSTERQIANLTEQVNESKADICVYEENMIASSENIRGLVKKINNLNEQIPDETVVSNITIRSTFEDSI